MPHTNGAQHNNHDITLAEAVIMTTRFRNQLPVILQSSYASQGTLPNSEMFDKQQFTDLLALPGAGGIRIYLGMNEENQVRLILVSVNDAGQDILPANPSETGYLFEYGQRCPPICGISPLMGSL